MRGYPSFNNIISLIFYIVQERAPHAYFEVLFYGVCFVVVVNNHLDVANLSEIVVK